MKNKKNPTISLTKEELQKQLKSKSSALAKMKRELDIEASLEQVRARTIAMKKSDELAETVSLLFNQLLRLGIKSSQLRTCAIVTLKRDEPIGECWITKPNGDIIPQSFIVPYDETSAYKAIYTAWKKGEKFLVVHLSGNALLQHLDFLKKHANIPTQQFQASPGQPTETYTHAMFFSQGYLFVISNEPLKECHDVFRRMGAVFQQTYTRFLDLQKAEAQAREAKIENALERVRSRTMAMQQSDELAEVALSLFQQVKELGITAWAAGFNIWQADNAAYIDWITGPRGDFLEPYTVDLTTHPIFQAIRDAKERRDDFFVSLIEGEQIVETYQLLSRFADKGQFQKILDSGMQFPTRQFNHFVFGAQVSLIFITYEPCPEAWDIFKRFGKVFEQTYTRFLDLQKAEAQSRESQIEASLERVRSRSMSMQKSEELRDVIQVIYEQLVQLGFQVDGAGFGMDYKESDDLNLWAAGPHLAYPPKIHIPYFDHPQFHRFKQAKESGLDFFTTNLTFDEKNRFWDHFFKCLPVPPETRTVFYRSPGYAMSQVLLKNVVLYIINFVGNPYTDAENATLRRFGKVFEQTYTRFNDLKQAEAQAVEANKRASVDRVRAEIASMRTTNDLERITPLIWNELTTLGVPFIRCGVFIMDKDQQQVQTFLSTPDGKAMASFHLPFHTPGEIGHIIAGWQRKELYKQFWDEAAFIEFTDRLVEQGAVTSGEKYLTENRPTSLFLHFLPFLQGMLYVGDIASLSDEHLQLVQALAEAFSTAYARYEDFNKLESANVKIEKTLIDLKLTQTQLVQSEKMASLGELTAGIAHEIQNPLNFVNNFSELNTELIEEMKNELEAGNIKVGIDIANSIRENEEKINIHGKRADSIVKGMLEHSRETTGQKEPTNINALADEYLRLSYQGLRAKDKAFNTTLKTDFDPTIENIPVTAGDIGRVLLNLYNNAFYVVAEKKKQQRTGLTADALGKEAYEPTVLVSTTKNKDKVEIRVKDNGNGIPEKIREKIFQPFFTTKPTGQGTGLGLSLSYDIIKAHGGEIKVQTKEGEGAEFIIQLPANNAT